MVRMVGSLGRGYRISRRMTTAVKYIPAHHTAELDVIVHVVPDVDQGAPGDTHRLKRLLRPSRSRVTENKGRTSIVVILRCGRKYRGRAFIALRSASAASAATHLQKHCESGTGGKGTKRAQDYPRWHTRHITRCRQGR